MLIRIGFDIELSVATPMALIYLLQVHPSRRDDLVAPENLCISGGLQPEEYIDSFGNRCARTRSRALTSSPTKSRRRQPRPDAASPVATATDNDARPRRNAMTNTPKKDEVQGEGDYEAARRYDKAARDFAESGRVEPAAHEAAPDSAAEAEAMKRAEEVGKSHSKGEGRLVSDKRKA